MREIKTKSKKTKQREPASNNERDKQTNMHRYFFIFPTHRLPVFPFLQVQATDADSGSYGQVRYSIVSVSGGQENLFDIDEETGQLYVVGEVERNERYIVVVQATDDPEGQEFSRYGVRF